MVRTIGTVAAALVCALLGACSGGPGEIEDATVDGAVDAARDASGDAGDGAVDAGDAGHDAALEAGPEGDVDAGSDAGVDAMVQPDAATPDAGMDASACECLSGPCCDGCMFRSAAHRCITNAPVTASCSGVNVYGGLCTGTNTVTQNNGDRYCPGNASTCTGTIDIPSGSSSLAIPCEPGGSDWDHPTVCRPDAVDPLGARCAMWCG